MGCMVCSKLSYGHMRLFMAQGVELARWWVVVGGEAAHTQSWMWEPGPDTCLLPLEKMLVSIYKGSSRCSMGKGMH